MKRFLAGIGALIISASFVLSENSPTINKLRIQDKRDNRWEPCMETDKRWFLIELPCNMQWPLSTILNPNNYRIGPGGGFSRPSPEDCIGVGCICAIQACPDSWGINPKPIITPSTFIHQDISTFYATGYSSYYIVEKSINWP